MVPRDILSLQHPFIKHLVKLRQNRTYRYLKRRVLLSGSQLIQDIAAQFPLRALLLEKGTSCPLRADHTFFVSPEILKKVTGVGSPEPLAAEIDMPMPANLASCNFLLILDGVSDPGNLGTLMRTALGLGWEAAFVTSGSTDPFNEKALRAAKGATFTLPWQCGTHEELTVLLKDKKMSLLAADPLGHDLAGFHPFPPLALALGNETHGLAVEIKKQAQLISIPMQGQMQSLNVAAAGAILMYHLKGSHEKR
jgi:RNA methyltransferase, TrmH family